MHAPGSQTDHKKTARVASNARAPKDLCQRQLSGKRQTTRSPWIALPWPAQSPRRRPKLRRYRNTGFTEANVANYSLRHAALFRESHGPRRRRIRGNDDEQGHRTVTYRVWTWRQTVLHWLFSVRDTFEPDSSLRRCESLDRSRQDHLGHRFGNFRIRRRPNELLCSSVLTRRCGSRLFRWHPFLSEPVVSGKTTTSRLSMVHDGSPDFDCCGPPLSGATRGFIGSLIDVDQYAPLKFSRK